MVTDAPDRTPKYGPRPGGKSRTFVYQLRMERMLIAEALLALYAVTTLAASLHYARLTTPWAALFLAGCVFTLTAQIRETVRREG